MHSGRHRGPEVAIGDLDIFNKFRDNLKVGSRVLVWIDGVRDE